VAPRSGPGPSGRPIRAQRRARLGAVVVALFALGAALFATGPVGAQTEGAYVALGDSFAAGAGVPTQGGGPAMCARSSADYPHALAAALGLALSDVTCSGATTADVLGSQRSADDSVPAQAAALGSQDALVTLTVGGDDLGFSGIVARCVAATPWGPIVSAADRTCHQTYDQDGQTSLAAALPAIRSKVGAVLSAIRTRAPQAAVVLVGYPDLLPPDSAGCWPKMPFTRADVPWLNGIEEQLNATLAAAAKSSGVAYVDTYGPSVAHNACTSHDTRWITPFELSSTSVLLHPNARGEAAMAALAAPVARASLDSLS
jgi:lysophospholipase L1-like esterase